ncbi:MAG: hypothetical protein ACJAYZ_000506, partial [Bacteroidia bacterium]
AEAVKKDGNPPQSGGPTQQPPNKKPNIDHSKGGEYVDYEEVE